MPAVRSYQQVLAGVKADLGAGTLTVGGKLPGERALAERFEVSRASVREALRILDTLGMVRSATGSGPEAGATVTADLGAPIGAALRWHHTSQSIPVADLVETRVLIETWSAVTAATRDDAAAGEATDDILFRLDATADPAEFLLLDAEFSASIARAADNVVVTAFLVGLRAALDPLTAAALTNGRTWRSISDGWRNDLRLIADAVSGGDGERAADLVAAHIYRLYRTTGVTR